MVFVTNTRSRIRAAKSLITSGFSKLTPFGGAGKVGSVGLFAWQERQRSFITACTRTKGGRGAEDLTTAALDDKKAIRPTSPAIGQRNTAPDFP